MTRDTTRVHGDRDLSDLEALFPRIPSDAPPEVKKLTIDIEDSKRVYAVHKASRRHHFQILVERFILQIRYGCISPICTTSTCFSCRKRLANGAPVRRYNSTSARTLAIHLASLDNPEQGLCHNAPAARPPPEIRRSSLSKSSLQNESKSAANGSVSVIETKDGQREPAADGRNEKQNGQNTRRRAPVENVLRRKSLVDLSILQEDVNTDHRSFVQNVVETVAYKMLEWLTPRNLQRLVQPQDGFLENENRLDVKIQSQGQSGSNNLADLDKKTTLQEHRPQKKVDQRNSLVNGTSYNGAKVISGDPTPKSVIEPDTARAQTDDLKKNRGEFTRHPTSPKKRKKSDPAETQGLKGILNKIPKTPEAGTEEISSPTLTPPVTKRKPSRQTMLTNPKIHVSEPSPLINEPLLPPTPPQITPLEAQTSINEKQSNIESSPEDWHQASNTIPLAIAPPNITSTETPHLPQSLSYLSIEIIEFMCDILQLDRTREKHFLQPQGISEILKRRRDNVLPLHRPYPDYSVGNTQRWRAFIEQSFFDVLAKPESLLQSFSDEEGKLFDTQTIWYLMLRMTRVAPSLVFDSLWNVAGTLFRPPKKLEEAYDWAKEFHPESPRLQDAISNLQAAQTINICLHALVAAAPLVFDSRQLANMSRIRSYGLTMLGRESSSLEPVSLCLQYEDVFTNDLAVRLARRLFAAIPTRRRLSELQNLHNEVRAEGKQEPDVLDTILGTLKFLDLGSPSILNFSNDERDLHEKRVPTLILDWARTVMLQDWKGTAEVPSDGPFGGALATMAAIYKNRKSLLLGDIHFRTEYFAERLDPVEMPLEWLSFRQNKKTVHLLDFPYLFNPSTLVTYFRAINYSRMNESYEQAKAKNNMVYSAVDENRLMPDKNRRDRLYERLRTSTTKFMVLAIRRTNVLVDTFNQIWRREERELLRPLKIRLGEENGEEGLDSGGVQQEFFRLAIAEALDPDYGAFTIDARTKMTWFQPGSPEPLWKFELIGMLLSLAVYNGLTLPVTFPMALYSKLLDEDVTELHHIADGWPDLANGLTTLLEWDEKDGLVEDIFARTYEFSVEQFGQPVSREMGSESSPHWPQFAEIMAINAAPDAPMVTNANRNSYVSDYIRWLTDISIAPQYEAFKKGFFSCLSQRSISLFDPSTLQSLIEGVQEIDISELRRATRYIGWDASHRTIRDFWSIVKKFDFEQKRKLLEFVTASDRVPVGGMRNVMFTIQKNGVGDGHLPSSYTCYGILLLPEFSGKEVLKERLIMALENSKGFGFA